VHRSTAPMGIPTKLRGGESQTLTRQGRRAVLPAPPPKKPHAIPPRSAVEVTGRFCAGIRVDCYLGFRRFAPVVVPALPGTWGGYACLALFSFSPPWPSGAAATAQTASAVASISRVTPHSGHVRTRPPSTSAAAGRRQPPVARTSLRRIPARRGRARRVALTVREGGNPRRVKGRTAVARRRHGRHGRRTAVGEGDERHAQTVVEALRAALPVYLFEEPRALAEVLQQRASSSFIDTPSLRRRWQQRLKRSSHVRTCR
jgi:hypothetical protein